MLKPGVHRCVARDGTVAAMIVADGGVPVDFIIVGREEPPPRPRRRWIAPSLKVLQERAERRRLEALLRTYERETGWAGKTL